MLLIHEHARTHGISDQDIRTAYDTAAGEADPTDDDPPRTLMVGFDAKGRTIELVVAHLKDGDDLVIHAMKATRNTISLMFRKDNR
jgi:hypothetical protein